MLLSSVLENAFGSNIAVGADGGVHVTWVEINGNYGWISYVGPVLVPQSGESTLSQVFSIPDTLTTPTLSFFYQLDGASAATGGGFSVLVDNGLTTTLLSASENTSGWTHAWFDLSPWLSQTITLTFNVHEVEDHPYTWAYLDEVTIGSAHPDVWVSAHGAPAAMPGDTVALQLSYGNRSPSVEAVSATVTATLPTGLIFASANLTPTVNGNILTWVVGDLPAGSGPFTIQVMATVAGDTDLGSELTVPVEITTATPELELLNNQQDYMLFIGSRMFLPVIVR